MPLGVLMMAMSVIAMLGEAEPALFEIPLNRKRLFHGVTQPDIDRYSDLFGAVNVRAELKK